MSDDNRLIKKHIESLEYAVNVLEEEISNLKAELSYGVGLDELF